MIRSECIVLFGAPCTMHTYKYKCYKPLVDLELTADLGLLDLRVVFPSLEVERRLLLHLLRLSLLLLSTTIQ